jgi:hypothetical protein
VVYPKTANCKTVSQRRCARLKDSATQHKGFRQYLQFAIGLTETDRAFTRFSAIVWGCPAAPRSLTQARERRRSAVRQDLHFAAATGKRECQSAGLTLHNMHSLLDNEGSK